MPDPVETHRADAPRSVSCAVITVSDTRTLETDKGGQLLIDRLTAAGHTVVARQIVPDEAVGLRYLLTSLVSRSDIEAVLITGGTGISHRDRTYETVSELLTRPLPGYGELFRLLSYEQVGAAAMLSRAVGGLVGRTAVFTMPGSPAAVALAVEKLLLPELGHVCREARR